MYKFQIFNFIPSKVFPTLLGICFIVHITWSSSIGPSIFDKTVSPLDMSINPCEDFYAYVCNNWIKSVPSSFNRFSQAIKQTLGTVEILKQLLEKPLETFTSDAERKAKIYYDSCIDPNNIQKELGAKPMLDLIKSLGSWSVTDKKYDVFKFKLEESLKIAENQYFIQALFEYEVDTDFEDTSRNVLKLKQPTFTVPADNLERYLAIMTGIGELLGGEKILTQDRMQKVMEFELKLANFSVSEEILEDPKMYDALTIQELQSLAGFMDWIDFFQDAFDQVHKKISKNTKILVVPTDYFKKLATLIEEYQKTSEGKIILNNYIIWRAIAKYENNLSHNFKPPSPQLEALQRKANNSTDSTEPIRCIAELALEEDSHLVFAVTGMFARETSATNNKYKQEIQKMIEIIRQGLINNIQKVEWMDEKTRKTAINKAESISAIIGYPDFVLDSKKLDKYYETLHLEQNTYFQNVINVAKFGFWNNLKRIDEPQDTTTWELPPLMFNAFYHPQQNQIIIPLGILQSPTYNIHHPTVQNYGAIGTVIGHELTHGFDVLGAQYDKDGNFKEWWNKETKEKFNNLASCYVKQYGSYDLNGKHINGNKTLPDNIADNAGLKATYYSYVRNFKEEIVSLQGKKFTDRQLFFVTFAQSWCSIIPDEDLEDQLLIDAHAPDKYRVIGTLQNSEEFSNAFKCKEGSYMNPKNKCELW